MAKPTENISWALNSIIEPDSGEPNKVIPSTDKQNNGWDYLEKPPFNWFNYWMNGVYKYIDWMIDEPLEGVYTFTGDKIFSDNVTFSDDIIINGSATFSDNVIINNGTLKLDDDSYIGCTSKADLMQLTATILIVNGGLKLNDNQNIGIDSDTDLLQLVSGTIVVNGNIRIDNNGYIGCDADTDLMRLSNTLVEINGSMTLTNAITTTGVGTFNGGIGNSIVVNSGLSSYASSAIYNALNTIIPNTNDTCILSGAIDDNPSTYLLHYAKKVSSSVITIYFYSSGFSPSFNVQPTDINFYDRVLFYALKINATIL